MTYRLLCAASVCAVLSLTMQLSDARAAAQCPAPQLDTTTDDPQQVLLDYLRRSEDLAEDLGLTPALSGVDLNALRVIAELYAQHDRLPLHMAAPEAGAGVGQDAVLGGAAKARSVIGGAEGSVMIDRNELIGLQQLATVSGGSPALNELTVRPGPAGEFVLERESVLPVLPVGPGGIGSGLLPPRLGRNLTPYRVVPGGDFGQPLQAPADISSGLVPKGLQELEQCEGPGDQIADYLEQFSPPSVMNSLFYGPPWNWQVRVGNDALHYVNLANNFDACCLKTLDLLEASVRQQIEQNTGVILETTDGGPAIARGSGTLIAPGVVVTARHVARTVKLERMRFSSFAAPSRLFTVLQVLTSERPYTDNDDPNDYAFLIIDGDTPAGLAVGPGPKKGLPLLIAAPNRITYQIQTLFQRVAGVQPSMPAWHRAGRWDAAGHCQV